MSYASEYVDLLSRLASSRGKRLTDIAAISGQAQMDSAHAWGQLPSTLAKIATSAYDQYGDQKKLELATRRQASTEEAARQTALRQERQYQIENDRGHRIENAGIAESGRKTAQAAKDSATAFVGRFGPSASTLIDEATSGVEAYKRLLPHLRTAAEQVALSAGEDPARAVQFLADEPTDDIFDTIQSYKGLFQDAFPQKLTSRNPEYPLVDTRGNVVSPGVPASPRPVPVHTQENGENVIRFVFPTAGASFPAPIPRPAAGAGGGTSGLPSANIPPPNQTTEMNWRALDGLKPETVKRARMLLTYDVSLEARNLNEKEWIDAGAAALAVDPNFSMGEFKNRVALQRSFKVGPDATNLGRAQTAVSHFIRFDKNTQQLKNSDFTAWNKTKNWAEVKMGGTPVVRAVKMDITALASELASLWKGLQASGTDIETAEWRASMDAADSPASLRAAFTEGLQLLSARVQSTRDKYSHGMGGQPFTRQLLSPSYREYLEKNGLADIANQIDPSYTKPMGSAAQSTVTSNIWTGAKPPTDKAMQWQSPGGLATWKNGAWETK